MSGEPICQFCWGGKNVEEYPHHAPDGVYLCEVCARLRGVEFGIGTTPRDVLVAISKLFQALDVLPPCEDDYDS